jgi:predicted transcriptional regulator YheO
VCSSTFFIKQEEVLVGFLCLNIDASAFQRVIENLGVLVRDYFSFGASVSESKEPVSEETFSDSLADLVRTGIKKALSSYAMPPERFSQEEKMEVIETLHEQGFFQLRGTVEDIAEELRISVPTVYRYLRKIQRGAKSNPGKLAERKVIDV